jgi:hypothetical protein
MNWRVVLLNGFWLLVPVFVWNLIFSSKLAHPAFSHDQNVVRWILIRENILRIAIMITPLFLTMNWDTTRAKAGWIVYVVGILVYFASWIPLMVFPDSAWSNSLTGFTAPAFTPLIWLTGIGLIGSSLPYIGSAIVFVGVHAGHWLLVYLRFG